MKKFYTDPEAEILLIDASVLTEEFDESDELKNYGDGDGDDVGNLLKP